MINGMQFRVAAKREWRFILVALMMAAGYLAFTGIADQVATIIHNRLPVYGDVQGSAVPVDKGLLVTGSARKIRGCFVREDVPDYWGRSPRDAAGWPFVALVTMYSPLRRTQGFPVLRPDGRPVYVGNLYGVGDHFEVGPFLVPAAPDIIAWAEEVTFVLPCRRWLRFEVTAKLGPFPVERPAPTRAPDQRIIRR